MQCSACRAVYSNALDLCPRCQTPVSKSSMPTETFAEDLPLGESIPAASAEISSEPVTAKAASTLIEFPGAGRMARPQWRKDLSERVREIQERRAREASSEPRSQVRLHTEQPAKETGGPQLGLVPTPDQPVVNPIVAAALKRLERAYQPVQPRARATHGNAAVAVAHVAEEQYQEVEKVEARLVAAPETLPETALPEKQIEAPREHTLTVVQAPPPAAKVDTIAGKPVPQTILVASIEEQLPETLSAEIDDYEEFYDDRAPVLTRMTAGLIDLLVIAFASSPFAAIIELTHGNWADERVLASMGGILLIIMFLYLTSSTALAGRTWGMSLVSLRAVDVDTGLAPTTKQSVARAIAYMLSLATLGVGILYALFDAEGRTAHDHLSGTAVVRE